MKFAIFFALSVAEVFGGDLASRYDRLSCAVVQIHAGDTMGTGFFVNNSGRLVTAAHVLYDKKFFVRNNLVEAEVTLKKNISFTYQGAIRHIASFAADADDNKRALVDLALLEVGFKSDCFIPLGDSERLRVGEHLIAIGFPASATSAVLYDGFLSAKHLRLPLPFGPIDNKPGYQYTPSYPVLRVQMPLTPGSSGSPIITDTDTVVGVESEAPIVMATDVERIADAFGINSNGSGVMLSGFDVTKTLGELAWTVKEFESPGAGLAVPISWLALPLSGPSAVSQKIPPRTSALKP